MLDIRNLTDLAVVVGTIVITITLVAGFVFLFRLRPSEPATLGDKVLVLILSVAGTTTSLLCVYTALLAEGSFYYGKGPHQFFTRTDNPFEYWTFVGSSDVMAALFLAIGIVILMPPKSFD